MPPPHILILYNDPVLPASHPDAESEREILEIVEAVAAELAEASYAVSRLGVSRDPRVLIDRLTARRPDAVFNFFEGTADQSETEVTVAGLLDWLHIPYTGCPFAGLCLARDKVRAKHLFRGAGLPTPAFVVVDELPLPEVPLGWPVIVKPATQDASVGLDQGSVVTSRDKLEARVASLLGRYGPPVMIEQFIRGRELNVAMIEAPELRALPISEILFLDEDPERWPIVTYDAKWAPESRDCVLTPPQYPATVETGLATRLVTLATRAFHLIGCRDYARCDFRVSEAGEPYLLEVNPNPCFNPTAGFTSGLKTAGISHAQFSVMLVENALRVPSRLVKLLRQQRFAARVPFLDYSSEPEGLPRAARCASRSADSRGSSMRRLPSRCGRTRRGPRRSSPGRGGARRFAPGSGRQGALSGGRWCLRGLREGGRLRAGSGDSADAARG